MVRWGVHVGLVGTVCWCRVYHFLFSRRGQDSGHPAVHGLICMMQIIIWCRYSFDNRCIEAVQQSTHIWCKSIITSVWWTCILTFCLCDMSFAQPKLTWELELKNIMVYLNLRHFRTFRKRVAQTTPSHCISMHLLTSGCSTNQLDVLANHLWRMPRLLRTIFFEKKNQNMTAVTSHLAAFWWSTLFGLNFVIKLV